MDAKWWEKVKEIFNHALDLGLEEREDFLVEACAGDDELRREVAELLAAYAKVGSFLQVPPFADDAPSPEPQLIGQDIANYRIDSLLGRGGMGEVYLAEDKRLHRKVALKLLPAKFTTDADWVRRFEREARAASATNHPNILTIYEIGHAEGLQFIATEFVDGVTLRQSMQSGGMSITESLSVAVQVASALSAAHEAGIIHRDIKPENIMVRPDGLVKVLDFGLAKLAKRPTATPEVDSRTQTLARLSTEPGVVMGTVSYMSPEQARRQEVDHRTDIFSLGVMLYEMLAGRRPFEGETSSDVIAAILRENPAPLPNAPAILQRIVNKALAKNCEERYQTVRELLSELRSIRDEINSDTGDRRWMSGALIPRNLLVVIGLLISMIAALVYTSRIGRVPAAQSFAIKSIAILPFKHLGAEEREQYLGLGIADGLITKLSNVRELIVRPTSAVRKYVVQGQGPLAAGREQRVDAVLDGSIQQLGDKIRVTVQLTSVRDGLVLWGYKCDEQWGNILKAQDSIAEQIATALVFKLTGEKEKLPTKRYTESIEAYQLYLKGRYFWNKRSPEGMKKSIEYFEQATKEDPNYALAYAAIADSYVHGYWRVPSKDRVPKALVAVEKALAIDDQLPEVHAVNGLIQLSYKWDWASAEKEYKHAIDLNPNFATVHGYYGMLLAHLGRFEESIAEAKRALEIDPLSLIINTQVGNSYYWAKRYDEAIVQYLKTLELDQNFWVARHFLASCYEQKGLYDKAIEEHLKACGIEKGDHTPEQKAELRRAYAVYGWRGYWQKEIDLAKDMQAKGEFVAPYDMAEFYARSNDKDQAFLWLDECYADRDYNLWRIKVEPIFSNLHADPRFEDLLRRIRLAQ